MHLKVIDVGHPRQIQGGRGSWSPEAFQRSEHFRTSPTITRTLPHIFKDFRRSSEACRRLQNIVRSFADNFGNFRNIFGIPKQTRCSVLLSSNQMIILVQFGINKLRLFQRLQIALASKIYSCLFIPNCTRYHMTTYAYQKQGWPATSKTGVPNVGEICGSLELLAFTACFLKITNYVCLPAFFK